MNCKNCGAPLVQGQIICSNCNSDNSMLYTNNLNNYQSVQNSVYNNNFNKNVDVENNEAMYNSSYDNAQLNNEVITNDEKMKKSKKKQNIFLRIASIFALLCGISIFASNIFDMIMNIILGHFKISSIGGVVISIILLFDAFMISNYKLNKNKLYDNKIIFVIFLCLNFIIGCSYRTYLLVFLFSLIGFVQVSRKE